ncbi:polysaccharide deacetylase family protein [Streptomyces sp. H10-C2]|uniref:polysaccharide deacetylase family protein n=1 Tax=unclassified Streptomyces TaxID=2593676 RepID=UPI0024BAD4AE|nr:MULTISPECIES: polysaccharide deacetylase family protein [unclassified Streptomyces]MDJ0339994.1 polysaccharide deacetylase family protein [Streptomyces sp. PH10-H1]MDJ0369369.1 polysaccharide deacetylase family protein [Streptomyces sp. H10-C2]
MALSSAKKTTAAALGVTLAGAALAACGGQQAARTAPSSTPSPAPSSATVPAQTRTSTPPASIASSAATPPSDGAPGGTSTTSREIQHGLEDGGKSVALTFDDGPDPRWTPQILALLAQHHAKATFCEIGPNAQAHPAVVKQITAAGHRLCDHSVHHDEHQSTKSLDYNTHEILDARKEITDAAGPGTEVPYYRAPGGDFKPWIREIAAVHGMRPLGWTSDSDDWKRTGTADILHHINANLRPGAIVLMHDGGGDRSQTVQALAKLLDQLDAQHYTYSFPGR